MERNPSHAMQAQPNADERARQGFVLALKKQVGGRLRPLIRNVYRERAAPAFEKRHGRTPTDEADMAEALYADDLYQTWCRLARTAQEMMWDAVAAPMTRQRDESAARFRELTQSPNGSLEQNPELVPPRALARIDIHLQPGGYLRDEGPDDTIAGSLYEAGGALYSQGEGIGTGVSKADVVMGFLGEQFPGFSPERILDMGCSAGSSSVPYALALPHAEVHAIDVGAGLLRYAHARAEALGATVHFHQRDVCASGFDDGTFDLVVSHNLMHELSALDQARMIRESFRLLRAGGIVIHQDVPLRYEHIPPLDRVIFGWDKYFNGEPSWDEYARNDGHKMLRDAGFQEQSIQVTTLEQGDGSFRWHVLAARKEESES